MREKPRTVRVTFGPRRPRKKQVECPECGSQHTAAGCYGGFDPDEDVIRWDGQP